MMLQLSIMLQLPLFDFAVVNDAAVAVTNVAADALINFPKVTNVPSDALIYFAAVTAVNVAPVVIIYDAAVAVVN